MKKRANNIFSSELNIILPLTLTGILDLAMPYKEAKRTAAPPISAFISSIPAPGFKEMPPLNKKQER